MRKATSGAAVAAFVMSGFVPAGLILTQSTSQSVSQLLCKGALGGEWAGAGACAPGAAPRPFN